MLTPTNQENKSQQIRDLCYIVGAFTNSSTLPSLVRIAISNVYPALECELKRLFQGIEYTYQKCDGLHLIRCRGYTLVFARITEHTPEEFMGLAIAHAESYNVLLGHLVNGYTRVTIIGSVRWET